MALNFSVEIAHLMEVHLESLNL